LPIGKSNLKESICSISFGKSNVKLKNFINFYTVNTEQIKAMP